MLRRRTGRSKPGACLHKIRSHSGSDLRHLNDLLLIEIAGLENDLTADPRLPGTGDELRHLLLYVGIVMFFCLPHIHHIVKFLAAVIDRIFRFRNLRRDRHLAERKPDSRPGQDFGTCEHLSAHGHRVRVDRDGFKAVFDCLIAELPEIFSGRVGFQVRVVDHIRYFFY